jgi:hypothetical protein
MQIRNAPQILILVPTRDRLFNVKRLIENYKAFNDNYKSFLVFVIDEDQVDLYKDALFSNAIIILPRQPLCKKLNSAYRIVKSNSLYKDIPIIGFMGDDHIFRTRYWEDKIINWQKSNIGICYGNDLLKGEEIPTSVFIHKEILKPLGFMVPPCLNHYFCDNFWKDLGLRLERIKYFPSIVIEHLHHINNKAYYDDLYKETEKIFKSDQIAWDNYVSNSFSSDVERINEYLTSNEHLSSYPFVSSREL